MLHDFLTFLEVKRQRRSSDVCSCFSSSTGNTPHPASRHQSQLLTSSRNLRGAFLDAMKDKDHQQSKTVPRGRGRGDFMSRAGRSEDYGERREWSWRGKGRGSHDKVTIKALFFWKEKLGELKFVFITSKNHHSHVGGEVESSVFCYSYSRAIRRHSGTPCNLHFVVSLRIPPSPSRLPGTLKTLPHLTRSLLWSSRSPKANRRLNTFHLAIIYCSVLQLWGPRMSLWGPH